MHFKISFAAAISCIGSSVRDTRIVAPMPSCSNAPMPIADLISPICAVPASVTPRCSGYAHCCAASRYASIMVETVEDFMEITISVKSQSSSILTCRMALSTRASAVGAPYFASKSFSSEPELTPIRIGICFD